MARAEDVLPLAEDEEMRRMKRKRAYTRRVRARERKEALARIPDDDKTDEGLVIEEDEEGKFIRGDGVGG